MSNYAELDKNFEVKTKLGREDIKLYDALSRPFSLHGVFYEDGLFRRMPAAEAEKITPAVEALAQCTAGGRIRFVTDSEFVAIAAKMPAVSRMPHFALTGSAGFDLYEEDRFVRTFLPPWDIADGYESLQPLSGKGLRQITVNFPTYSSVASLYIGLQEGARLLPPAAYERTQPVVYYGSSITQGGCASRPGNTYQAILSRMLQTDYINLGFSGNARGEAAMAHYIAGLSMRVFVMDYDHNAPDPEHLRRTHGSMFQIIRKAQPFLPIVILSRPSVYLNAEERERREIIRATWRQAVENGDRNVYFIDGQEIFKDRGGDSCTVDACHPNDLGFMAMAQALFPVLKPLL